MDSNNLIFSLMHLFQDTLSFVCLKIRPLRFFNKHCLHHYKFIIIKPFNDKNFIKLKINVSNVNIILYIVRLLRTRVHVRDLCFTGDFSFVS